MVNLYQQIWRERASEWYNEQVTQRVSIQGKQREVHRGITRGIMSSIKEQIMAMRGFSIGSITELIGY